MEFESDGVPGLGNPLAIFQQRPLDPDQRWGTAEFRHGPDPLQRPELVRHRGEHFDRDMLWILRDLGHQVWPQEVAFRPIGAAELHSAGGPVAILHVFAGGLGPIALDPDNERGPSGALGGGLACPLDGIRERAASGLEADRIFRWKYN